MVHKYDPEYYQKHKEKVKARRKKYRAENRDKIRAQQREWYRRKIGKRINLKYVVLAYYGDGKTACVKCGFKDLRALTLDHVIPIGQQKRRITGINFYKKLQDAGYPEGYQTLCANCQMIKMFEGNEWKLNL